MSHIGIIPIDAHIVENTTLHKESTAVFWGAKNKELMTAREAAENEIEKSSHYRFRYQMKQAKMIAANSINELGHFVGKNVMEKIIKLCSLSLIYYAVPPIDLYLLRQKELFMFGKPLMELDS